jgi:lysophospholipase L1-like esterase
VDHAVAKPSGTFRVLGLGDSFTYGVGVAFEDTYLSRLERMLNARAGTHPRAEVIKTGIPRYFPEPERILLERYGAQFQPDVIVVGFLPNDVIDTYLGMEAVKVDTSGFLKTREAEQLGWIGTEAYRHCHFCRIILKAYVARRIDRTYPLREEDVYRAAGFHEKDWAKIEREYEKMLAVADSIHAKMAILHIPQRGPWLSKHQYPAERLAAWAAAHHVGFIDALPAIERGASKQPLYYEKDGHCTAAGQAILAQELYTYLTQANVVP